jgi:hypothetical protein
MLGANYRWQIYNGTGVTVIVTLDVKLWKFDSSGALVFSAESTPINAASTSTLAYSNSAGVNNTVDKYIGAQITALFDVAASATGNVVVYLQQSTDGGTTWPSDGQGFVLGSYYFNASAVDALKNFKVD